MNGMQISSALLLSMALGVSCSSDDSKDSGPSQVQCATGLVVCGKTCVDPTSDALHCGSCSTMCGVGQSCVASDCACQASLTACGSSCVDLDSSGANCGACGNACDANEVCSNQTCGSSCAAGETACGQDCVDLDTSAAHCGACSQACPTGQLCQSGACQCDGAGQTLCGGACVSTDTDPQNCGACGNQCGASETCQNGQCIASGNGGSGGGGTGGAAGSGGTGGGGTGGGGTGGTGGSGGGATGLIDPSRVTTWNPGVSGGVPDSTGFTLHATVALGGNAGTNRTNIQNAINAAGAVATAQSPRVVALPAGSWHINGRINLNQNYVVLRGAGPNVNGAGGGTRLIMDAVDTDMFFMGNYTDWGSAKNLAADAVKGSSTFTLAAGHGVQAGDMLVIDRLDDSGVTLQGGNWWKRGPGNSDNGPASPGGYRSIGQVVEVTGVSGNVITIAGVLHHDYPVATYASQVFGSTDRRAGWAGIGLENMTITGWGDAMGVYANWQKNSWIKRVEFDGQPTSQGGYGTGTRGNDTRVFRSVRFTIEGSYLHHSRVYMTNNNAYSISLAAQTSDTLLQDNTVWFKNKNVVLEASGGGNVVAYNYLEDPVIADSGATVRTDWMEMCLDGSHLSHPSMDLFEGNYVAKMGAAETHGNAGDQTFFRNYSKGNRLHTISDSASVASVMLNRYMRRMNFVGNVLTVKEAGSNAIYAPTFDASGNMPWSQVNTPKIWSLGLDGYDGNWQGPRDPVVEQELVRLYNYDYVTNQVDEEPAAPLPNSLFLSGKPAYFGSNAWPWVNPLGTTAADRVKTLPAQARFAAGTFL